MITVMYLEWPWVRILPAENSDMMELTMNQMEKTMGKAMMLPRMFTSRRIPAMMSIIPRTMKILSATPVWFCAT